MTTVKRISNVLSPELLGQVRAVIDAVPWRYGWASNKSIEFTHWNYSFVKACPLNTLNVSDQISGPIADAWRHIEATITGPAALLRCYTNSHTYGVEGYPHTDSRRAEDKTLLIYMNPHWQRDWGGETTVYNNDEIAHAELPKYNNGLIFNGADWHSARSVTRICPAQRITLMFKYSALNVDPQRDRIQTLLTLVGAEKIKHSGRNLWTHLLNVYDILREYGYGTEVCAAGGLHSIFGTNVFTQATLTLEQRDMVANTIGPEATQYVELFSALKRPNTLESALANQTTTVEMNDGSTRLLTSNELSVLCAIEAANLSDQKALKNYPNIGKFLTKTSGLLGVIDTNRLHLK